MAAGLPTALAAGLVADLAASLAADLAAGLAVDLAFAADFVVVFTAGLLLGTVFRTEFFADFLAVVFLAAGRGAFFAAGLAVAADFFPAGGEAFAVLRPAGEDFPALALGCGFGLDLRVGFAGFLAMVILV